MADLTDLDQRWTSRLDEFQTLMTGYGALPSTTTDDDRTAALVHAGRVVSTTVIAPLPPIISDLQAQVVALGGALAAARTNLRAIIAGAGRFGATLAAAVAFAPQMPFVDYAPLDLTVHRDAAVALARELRRRVAALHDDIVERLARSSEAVTRAGAATGEAAQTAVAEAAQALLGSSFVVVTAFTPSPAVVSAWGDARSRVDASLQHLTTGPDATPLPLDDWLDGLARVRDRAADFERTAHLYGLSHPSPAPGLDLVPLQFPSNAGDPWLGLRFPILPTGQVYQVPEDKLLLHGTPRNGAPAPTLRIRPLPCAACCSTNG